MKKGKLWVKLPLWTLFLATPLFLVLIINLRFNPLLQFIALLSATLLYLEVTLLHHFLDKTLTMEIALEYMLIAALALIIFQSILF